LADRRPGLTADVLELGPVVDAAKALLDRRGYGGKVGVVADDMFVDSLPGGYDLHL
jgi:hypothetical protein